MHANRVGTMRALALVTGMLIAASALAQTRTEIRDPLRGVSFHSISLGNDPVNSLAVLDGTFSDSDRLTVGLSVLVFDASHLADQHILWVRHEGRRWLDFGFGDPVVVEANGSKLALEPLRASQPSVGSGTLYEKIEFKLDQDDLAAIIESTHVKVRLSSGNGVVEKVLSAAEIASLAAFAAEVGSPAS